MTFSSAVAVLPVSHWAKVLPWYREVLGCRVVHVDESLGQVVHLEFGRQRFGLWLDWGDPAFPRATGLVREVVLALTVRSLAEARRTLKARGAVLGKTPTGLLTLTDPEGNQILVMAAPKRRDARMAQRRALALEQG